MSISRFLLATVGLVEAFVSHPIGLSAPGRLTSSPFAAPVVTPPALIMSPICSLLSTALRWGLAHCTHQDDFLLAMASPEAYWLLREWRRTTYGDLDELRHTLRTARDELLLQLPEGTKICVRTKGLWSTFHKAAVRGQTVHDVLALRVVVRGDDDEKLYAALEAVRELYPSANSRFKDYVARPKANGYRALHDTLVLPSGAAMEVQFRTEVSHREAQYGAAAHGRYKGALCYLPATVLRGIARVSDLETGAKRPSLGWRGAERSEGPGRWLRRERRTLPTDLALGQLAFA